MLCSSGSMSIKSAGVSSSLTGSPIGLSCMVVLARVPMRFSSNSRSNVRRHLESATVFAREQRVGMGLVERLACRVEGELLSRAKGDVAEVAQPGAQVADLDVGIRFRAALDAIKKVLHVACLPIGPGLAP